MKKLKRATYPLAIYDEDNNLLAYIDMKGYYHCQEKNRLKVVNKLMTLGDTFNKISLNNKQLLKRMEDWSKE